MKDRETVMRGLKYFYLYKVLIFNPSLKTIWNSLHIVIIQNFITLELEFFQSLSIATIPSKILLKFNFFTGLMYVIFLYIKNCKA